MDQGGGADMGRDKGRTIVVAVLGACLLAGVAARSGGRSTPDPSHPRMVYGFDMASHSLSRLATRGFSLRAHVHGLYPGRLRRPRLIVKNPLSVPIRITTLAVTAGDPDSGCASSNFRIRTGRLGFLVEPRTTRTIRRRVLVKMRSNALDVCQSSTTPLRLSGTAVTP